MAKPVKLTVAEAIAASPELARLLEEARASEQRKWENETRTQLIERGHDANVATYTARHSRTGYTAEMRAVRVASVLRELNRIARES